MARANGITRQEILTCIKVNGDMTADSLAQHMGISQVAVRQHLASLEAEGLIEIRVERRGLGRPSHRYSLTRSGDETFPRHYDAFALALLRQLRNTQGQAAVETLLNGKREQERAAVLPRFVDKPLSAKVFELARLQSENGYMAEACAEGDDVYTLLKRNCAVCVIAREFPSVCCHGETAVFESLLGKQAQVTHERAIVDGATACQFRIALRESGDSE